MIAFVIAGLSSFACTAIAQPGGILTTLHFTNDYTAGTRDRNGAFMGGTEMMALAGHKGALYAAVGYGQDVRGADPETGGQVLRKTSPLEPWIVDLQFDTTVLRTECLLPLVFTRDGNGRTLDPPLRLLTAGPSTIYKTGELPWASIWVRDDNTDSWEESRITRRHFGVRSMGVHTDAVTNRQRLFAGLNVGSIFSAVLDTSYPGLFRWESAAELSGVGRVMSFCVCNGVLYASTSVEDSTRPLKGGIYRRIDGTQPRWEKVFEAPYYTPDTAQSGFIRGLTAVPDPNGGPHQVILAALEYRGLILRIDPTKNHEVTTELDLIDYFNREWNDSCVSTRGIIAAYNRFTPVRHHETGDTVWMTGVWTQRHGYPNPPYNCSYYVVRSADGGYGWGTVYDYDNPLPLGTILTGTRDVEPSPFPGDSGRAFYFCGYDGGAGPSHNTAWMFRGVHAGSAMTVEQAPESLECALYPNPCTAVLTVYGKPREELAIYDILGRSMWSGVGGTPVTLNTTRWSAGTYILAGDAGRHLLFIKH